MPNPTDTPLTTLAAAAFRQAAAKVVRRAKQTGTPLIVWERGEIRLIPPDVRPEEGSSDNLRLFVDSPSVR